MGYNVHKSGQRTIDQWPLRADGASTTDMKVMTSGSLAKARWVQQSVPEYPTISPIGVAPPQTHQAALLVGSVASAYVSIRNVEQPDRNWVKSRLPRQRRASIR